MKQTNHPFYISLNLFNAVFETAPDIAVNLLNKDYSVLWANKIMANLVLRQLDEMIGKPCYQAFRRRDNPCPVCLLQIVSDTKNPCIIERWLDLPNLERRYAEVRAYPIFDKQGFVKHIFEILIPLNEKKKDEQRYRRYVESLEETLREFNVAGAVGHKETPTDEQEVILTLREQEVLRLIAQGFSNKDIARILNISFDTVKTHVRNIFYKLNVTDRTKAAVQATSRKLI